MKITAVTRRALAIRRQRRDLLANGWMEVGERGGGLWRLHRGDLIGHRIEDVVISADRMSVFLKISDGVVSDSVVFSDTPTVAAIKRLGTQGKGSE